MASPNLQKPGAWRTANGGGDAITGKMPQERQLHQDDENTKVGKVCACCTVHCKAERETEQRDGKKWEAAGGECPSVVVVVRCEMCDGGSMGG